jgi:Flp pilus assembly protein TadD
LERLGWLFVAKARQSFDPGFYKLAEQCALCLETRQSQSPEALLLRGHALHSLHRFQEAEELAWDLVARRGLAFDHGLLGDVLMEQGKLDQAVTAYQTMLDLKPDLHAYARAAHVRWLKGDLEGALELMHMAAAASSPRDPESAAWVHARLALYQFQGAQLLEARLTCESALALQKDYPPALLLSGRLHLAEGDPALAVEDLTRAAQLNPLPEYQWVLAEALREAGQGDHARAVEQQLGRQGAVADARTFALYLATRQESPETAVRLATRELQERADVFTHDALAWALAAAGRFEDAWREMMLALAEGTQDARLFYHAALIAARSHRLTEARAWFDQAAAHLHFLLPSEREDLLLAALLGPETDSTAMAAAPVPTLAAPEE